MIPEVTIAPFTAGVTNKTGSWPFCIAANAAIVRAGGVFHASGSISTPAIHSILRAVSFNRESSPSSSSRNCLRYFSRESGQRRVPEAPQVMEVI